MLWGGRPGGLSVNVPRLRAPREDGGVLAEPPLEQVGKLLARNHDELSAARLELLGKPIAALRRLAQANAWEAARQYHADAGEPLPAAPVEGQNWLLAGHQPELFHPGVWAKNFALKGLAERHAAFSLNLVVDNDAAKAPLLHVPNGRHVASIPYDHWQGNSPYEERAVLDEALFASLPARTQPFVATWPFTPMLPAFWQEVLRHVQRTPLLGERLAAARRTFERQWGCLQAEVPLSRICQGEAFAWFACHLLLNAARLRQVYNDAVHAYRRRYGLRSTFHPVPDLAEEGEWLELPMWGWRAGQHRRARLFVRQTPTELQLRAGKDAWPMLALGDPNRLVAQWRALEPRGFKVRTRALTTTLYARLMLGDLFIHGIGGAKYDELADALIERFFDCPVPGFLVLTATRLLPLPRFDATPESCRELARKHRDLWYNPQRHFPGELPPAAQRLVREKQAWIARVGTTHAERRERFRKLRALNEQLRPFLQAEEQHLAEERDQCRDRLAVNQVSGRRDYAFCLYPAERLQELYQGLLHHDSRD
jgi:hypothetical protein